MKYVDLIAYVLLIAAGLNWGLVGVFDFNLVSALFGAWPMFEKALYAIIGLAGIYKGVCLANKGCSCCTKDE